MPTCHGIGTVELVCFVALAGLVIAAALLGHHWIAEHAKSNYERGLADKQLEWDKSRQAAEDLQRRKDTAVALALLVEEKRRIAAETAAADTNAKWEADRREARRRGTQLVACPQPGPDRVPGASGSAVAGTDAGSGARADDLGGDRVGVPRAALFTWQFVREYDAAWTGADGQPVSPTPSGDEATASAGAASPYGADDVLEVHGANARRCSEDRREFAALIRKLESAAGAVDNQGRH